MGTEVAGAWVMGVPSFLNPRVWKSTWDTFDEHKGFRLASSLAFGSVLTLSPMLVILLGVASIIWGDAASEGRLLEPLTRVMGQSAAETLQSMVQAERKNLTGGLAALVGFGLLIFTASGFIERLKDTLNTLWDLRETGAGIKGMILNRLQAALLLVVMAASVAAVLFVSFSVQSWGEAISRNIGMPEWSLVLWPVLLFTLVLTLVFAAVYRFVPNAWVPWRDLWTGAAASATLFVLGQLAISIYFAQSGTATAFGAAGSVIVLLLWLYYSSVIFLFGAQFTHCALKHRGHDIEPSEDAVRLTDAERIAQGMPTQEQIDAAKRASESPPNPPRDNAERPAPEVDPQGKDRRPKRAGG